MITGPELAFVLIRVYAVKLAADAVAALPFALGAVSTLSQNAEYASRGEVFSPIYGVASTAVVALALWTFALPIVGRLIPTAPESEKTSSPMTATSFYPIALSIFGVILCASGLVLLFELIAKATVFAQAGPMGAQAKANFVTAIAKVILGAGLILGSTGVAGLVSALRTRGVSENDS